MRAVVYIRERHAVELVERRAPKVANGVHRGFVGAQRAQPLKYHNERDKPHEYERIVQYLFKVYVVFAYDIVYRLAYHHGREQGGGYLNNAEQQREQYKRKIRAHVA